MSGLSRATADTWREPPKVRAEEWIAKHIRIPDTKETPGPFDLDMVPHVRGVLQRVDSDPNLRNIFARWAARGAKTTTFRALLIYLVRTRRLPSMFGSADEERADDTIANDLYPMLEACEETRRELLPEHKRNKRAVVVGSVRIRRAYAGSPSTMAGFPAAFGLANEVSKWGVAGPGRGKNSAKQEAHPAHLFRQRGKLFPFDSLFLFESTPTRVGDCLITALCEAASTQRLYYFVPCPHCGEYQRLVWGDDQADSPGVKWQRPADAHSDPILAERTAWYRCVSGCRVENADRPAMMRAGQWVAEGQSIDKSGKITGKPAVESGDVAFDGLSTLYSLLISGWGQLAAEWVKAQGDPERLRDFINSTLAEPYNPKPRAADPHVVAKRLCIVPTASPIVPAWASFITSGVDIQQSATRFPYVVSAWGANERGHLVEHGELHSWDEIRELQQSLFAWENSTDKSVSVLTLIDSGNDRDEVYPFCLNVPRTKPCKGASHEIKAGAYQLSKVDQYPGLELFLVDTYTSNRWLQKVLEGFTKPDERGFYSLGVADQFDLGLIGQLINGMLYEKTTNGRLSRSWDKVHEGVPDDWRDCVRYSWAAAQYLVAGTTWDALPPRVLLQPDMDVAAHAPVPEPQGRFRDARRTFQRR